MMNELVTSVDAALKVHVIQLNGFVMAVNEWTFEYCTVTDETVVLFIL